MAWVLLAKGLLRQVGLTFKRALGYSGIAPFNSDSGCHAGTGRQRFGYLSRRGFRYRLISILLPDPPARHLRALPSMQICADPAPEQDRQGVQKRRVPLT